MEEGWAGLGWGARPGCQDAIVKPTLRARVLQAWVSRTPSLPPWVLVGPGGTSDCVPMV